MTHQLNRLIRFSDPFTGACIYDLKLALETHPGTRGQEDIQEGVLAVIIVGPMLGTNILSTSLIAWKAWYARGNTSLLSVPHDDVRKGSTAALWVCNSKRAAVQSAWKRFSRF
jgi:hypothetical protein